MSFTNPLLQTALQHHQNQNFEEAEKAYKLVLAENELDTSIYPNMVDIYNRQGRFEDSIEFLIAGIKKAPSNPQLPLMLSQTYLHIGIMADAIKTINNTIKNFPHFAPAYNLKGNIFIQQKKVEEALAVFEQALAIDPKMAEIYFNMGAIYFQQEKLDKAEENWKKTLEINPNILDASLNLANLYIIQNKYRESIQATTSVLKIDPDHYSALKMNGMAEHAVGNIEVALKQYLKIHNEEKPTEEVLTLIANAYRDLDKKGKALKYYEDVILLNPDHKIAKQNIQTYNSQKISNWHFMMLSDLKRNDGFYDAIKRKVNQGDSVLDIGTGTGLLSMMCAKVGAEKVYTCESVKDIANSAKTIIADNHLENQVIVFNKKSTKLVVGKDIPKKVDVLVSEILDCGLLGEGVLPSVRHAKANLLKEGGKIIPAAATLKAILIESDSLRSVSSLKNISGFDLSRFTEFDTFDEYNHVVLKQIPYKSLSEEKAINFIDFYNLPPSTSPENANTQIIEIDIIEDGRLDSLAFWFDLQLDHELSLSSGPEGEMFHWGQAEFTFSEPKEVKKGDLVRLEVHQSEMAYRFFIL